MGLEIDLICPNDEASLRFERDNRRYLCPACGEDYPIEDGVIRILRNTNAFYEAAYRNQIRFLPMSERPIDVWPLWIIQSGYLWLTRRHVGAGATVVELGCAGGVAYFGKRYRMIGCDVSFESLRANSTIYCASIQADVCSKIPLPAESVDAVVSSFFWEHLTEQQKATLLVESYRILKPGGKLIFLYDIETRNPLLRLFISRRPDQYKTLFQDLDGHVGYKNSKDTIRQMERSGFRVRESFGNEKTIFLDPSAYSKLAHWGNWFALPFSWLSKLDKSPWIYPYLGLVRVVDATVGALLPISWSRTVITVAQKIRR